MSGPPVWSAARGRWWARNLIHVKEPERVPADDEGVIKEDDAGRPKTVTTTKFTTQPFTCPSCIRKIETVVGRLAGVTEVKVLFNSSKVKVTHDASVIEARAIADKITDLGYPVISHKSAAHA